MFLDRRNETKEAISKFLRDSYLAVCMWEGPSWQCEVVSGQSPPTKWPRVTTPPNRRHSIFNDLSLNDSGLGDSFCSPPLNQKRNMRISPLRTPGSTKSSNSFSPFGRFRVSSFSTPQYSDRALRLSNNENILDYKFCEDTLEKNRGRLDIGKIAASSCNAASLNLPVATEGESEELDIKPDPATLQILETPSKGFNLEDSGVFDGTFNFFGNSPLKNLFFDNYEMPQNDDENSLNEVLTADDSSQDEPLEKRSRLEESSISPFVKSYFSMPFSRRWLRYTTGTTRTQREITSAAHAFLAKRRAAKQSKGQVRSSGGGW